MRTSRTSRTTAGILARLLSDREVVVAPARGPTTSQMKVANQSHLEDLQAVQLRRTPPLGVARASGGGATGGGSKKWRSGHVPPPPSFAGDIEADPYCLWHYKKALGRWQKITQEFLPRNEQAEVSDDRYNCDRGLELLIEDLSVAFREKELFRRGGLIRECE